MREDTPQKPVQPEKLWIWNLALVGVLLGIAAIRWRLLDLPLDRDEGGDAYAAQLLLQGIPPYVESYTMRLPGVTLVYAGILSLFGETARGIHLGLLLLNAATSVLLFLLARRLFGPAAGFVAAAAFATLSLGHGVHGVWASAEHFVLFFAVAGLYVEKRAIDSGRLASWALAGFLMGIGLLMKQHGIFLLAAGGLVLLHESLRPRPLEIQRTLLRAVTFAAAALLPLFLTVAAMAWAGELERFTLWTYTYPQAYTNQLPLAGSPMRFFSRFGQIAATAPGLWALAAVGFSALFWDQRLQRHRFFLLVLAGLSWMAILPGLYFRHHYFLLWLPAIALLVGVSATSIGRRAVQAGAPPWATHAAVALSLIAVGQSLFTQRQILFEWPPEQTLRFVFGTNPFPESVWIGDFLRDRSEEDDRIAVVGSEPQIAFYAQRKLASGYMYTYALMEQHPYAEAMQVEMAEEIEANTPRFIVFVNVATSWLATERSSQTLIEWLQSYLRDFHPIARVELGRGAANYVEGPDLARAPAPGAELIHIYERNP